MDIIVLYNPYSNNDRGEREARKLLKRFYGEHIFFQDLTEISDLPGFFAPLREDTHVILCGGDGTLNRFLNNLGGRKPECLLSYYPAGSGNDFYNDLAIPGEKRPVLLGAYLENLPTVTVGDKRWYFLNGVGYGIDGYCCEEGDRQRQKSDKKTNYTRIALKGLLFDFQPVNAKVTVDGEAYDFRRVWLAPTMKGRFYGGGMMIAPGQNRQQDTLSLVVLHDCNKYQILGAFPTIMTGRHTRFTSIVTVLTGREITVEFDRPTALQIDGETLTRVTSYRACAEGKIAEAIGQKCEMSS